MTSIEPVGIAEIAQRAGVAEITVRKWIERHPFPAPRWRVSGRDAWDWTDVHDWLRATGRAAPDDLARIAAAVQAATPALLATLAAVEQLADALEMPPGPERPYAVRPAIEAVDAAVADLGQHSLPYLLSGVANDARHAVMLGRRSPAHWDQTWVADEVRPIADSIGRIIRQTPTIRAALAA